MSLGTCHHGMYIARCMVPCLMDHDTLGQTRCALEVLGKLVRLSLSETLTLLALTLMEIDMVKGQKLCFSTHFSHEIPWCHDVFRMKSFCIISFHVVALRNASHPMIRLPFRSFGRCFNETVQGRIASVRTETAKSVSSHRIGVLRSQRVPLKHAHACAHRYLSTSI